MIEFIFGFLGAVVFIGLLLLVYWANDLEDEQTANQPCYKTTACNQRCRQGRDCDCSVRAAYERSCDMQVTEYDQQFNKRG